MQPAGRSLSTSGLEHYSIEIKLDNKQKMECRQQKRINVKNMPSTTTTTTGTTITTATATITATTTPPLPLTPHLSAGKSKFFQVDESSAGFV